MELIVCVGDCRDRSIFISFVVTRSRSIGAAYIVTGGPVSSPTLALGQAAVGQFIVTGGPVPPPTLAPGQAAVGQFIVTGGPGQFKRIDSGTGVHVAAEGPLTGGWTAE